MKCTHCETEVGRCPQCCDEWKYRYAERIGILCGDRKPTEAEHRLAVKEANEAVPGKKS